LHDEVYDRKLCRNASVRRDFGSRVFPCAHVTFPAVPQPVRPTDQDLAGLRGRVPDVVLETGARIGVPVEFAVNERLFHAGDPVMGVHLILAGAVRIIREGEGRAVIVHRERAGGLLGEVALFSGGAYPASAIAMERTRALLLPADALRRALRTSPALSELLLHRLAARAREVITRLDRLAHQSVLRRLAHHLAERGASAPALRGAPVSLGMTQVELAEELGTVKEVVVRELRALRRLRLIAPAGRGLYHGLDLTGLRTLAGEPRSQRK
jgi:CRP/FNR family transcriptional regulator